MADVNSSRATAAMVGLLVVAAFATVMMPLMLGAFVDHLGLSAREAGLVAAAEMSGVFCATLGIVLVVHRWNRRGLALGGLLLLLAADLAAAAVSVFPLLAGARFVAGLGAGLVIATMKASIAATRDPVRVFGVMGMSLLLTGAIGLPLLPKVIQPWGTGGAYLVLAALVLPGLPLLRWLPPYAVTAVGSQPSGQRVDIPWAALGLVALLSYFISFGAVGPFMERLGVASGLEAASVGRVLGAGSAAGIAGAALATWLGIRAGRAWPFCIAVCCSIGSLWLLVGGMRPATFVVAAIIVNAAALFTGPYVLGSLAALDRQGRVLVTGLMMQAIGLAAGPALAGLLIADGSYARVGWLGIVGYSISFVLFLPLMLRLDRRQVSMPAPDGEGK